MTNLKLLLGPMRAPFLILAPACVFLGIATAALAHARINPWYVVLVLIGAVASHISVNALNEYADFQSGLDFKTMKTPFSGGSGTLPAQPGMARAALITGLAGLAITAAIGIFFTFQRGWGIVPLGLAGLIVIVIYTNWITRNWLLCLVSPGLGFGTLMVMGTDFVMTGRYSWVAFLASLVPFFLVSNLLLLNQFPDAPADQSVGRRHLPIVAGRRVAAIAYDLFLLATYASIVAGVALGLFPAWALLGLLTMALAVPAGLAALRYADDPPRLAPAMGMNVLINVLTPLFLGVGLLIGA